MLVRRLAVPHAALRARSPALVSAWRARGRVASLTPALGILAALVFAGTAAAASGGGDFPIWRR